MQNNNQDLVKISNLSNLSKQQLIDKLLQAQLETVKYVNKFLEVQEKWAFINILLKKLNSIKDKKVLCDTIAEGLLTLTNSRESYCCFFNEDTHKVGFKKHASISDLNEKKWFVNFLKEIDENCFKFLQTSANPDVISNYFAMVSEKQKIIVPICFGKDFLGYVALLNDSEDFYRESFHFINVFPEHFALILSNISMFEELERSNRNKIEFLAGISHEFKTPLNSVIGFSEILKAKCHDVESFRYIDNISQSSKHLLALIHDVLDVAKAQCKSIELNYKVFRPKELIIQILESLDVQMQAKNIDLQFTLTDLEITADLKRFRQLIFNLVSNAIKFNKIGGKITIFTYIKEDSFVFEITDTGDGISKKNFDKIFGFFSQVNRSQLKRQLGSGIGLALCKIIVDAHGGEIDFSSQIKKGSSFWFSLPLKKEM